MIRFCNKNGFPYLYLTNKRKSSTAKIVHNPSLEEIKYKAEIVETKHYDNWEKNQYFEPEFNSENPNFSMLLPPPNITGKLHLGHALSCTIQDVIARRKRSLGYNVLWLPGTDHAGIATQSVVEKYLLSTKNIDRQSIGRENFIKEVWKWKGSHGNTISNQLRRLGLSLDWSREVFTMDTKYTHAVNTAFIELFEKGLIYRSTGIINWCNTLKSTVSDIEVENLQIDGPTEIMLPGYNNPVKFGLIYTFAYKVTNSEEEVLVSTTLPETMLGDTAVAVHPEDERYKHLRGATVYHPFRQTIIPIIHDDMVDMKFGTGAVKITPAHSKVDHGIGKRYNLPSLQILDEEGKIQNSGKFDGTNKYECRKIIVEELNRLGLMKSVDNHNMFLPVCSRTGDVIEYVAKEQWFLSSSAVNERAMGIVNKGQLKIEPERFTKKYTNWITEDREWCISRQLWWGHQIPAYKCSVGDKSIWLAAIDENSAKLQALKVLKTVPEEIKVDRDTDVLDTWFSSAIYPLAALGWPNKNNGDLKKFFPINLMVTGHDILGFWVYRMVILSLMLCDTIPFNNVLLHGVLCDQKGSKMSKSKGNVIDPIDVIDGISLEAMKEKAINMHKNGTLNKKELDKTIQYQKSNFSNNGIPNSGTDALRFTLLSYEVQSEHINFDVHHCNENKLFGNKIWQSVRYTQLCFDKLKPTSDRITIDDLTLFDKWILSKLAYFIENFSNNLDENKFHVVTRDIKALLYYRFCNEYLEATKPGFLSDNVKTGYAHAHTLSAVLNASLRCLAPFMVYLTHELIPKIPAFETNIIHNFDDLGKNYFDMPKIEDFSIWKNEDVEKQTTKFLQTISEIRELRGLYDISYKTRPQVYIQSKDEILLSNLCLHRDTFLNLTRSSCVKFEEAKIKNIIRTSVDDDTSVCIEVNEHDFQNVMRISKSKWEKKINKLNIKKTMSKDSNIVIKLQKEIEQLQRKIQDINI